MTGGSNNNNDDNTHYETTGTRTGVRSEVSGRPSGQFERLDNYWAGAKTPAKTPDPADIAAGEKPAVEIEGKREDQSKERPAKPYMEPRLSLPGASKQQSNTNNCNDDNTLDGKPIKESRAHVKARDGNFSSISTSDISMVSTAPPTPGLSPMINNHHETPSLVTQTESSVEITNNNKHAFSTSGRGNTNNDTESSQSARKHHEAVEEPIVDSDDRDDDDNENDCGADLAPPNPAQEDDNIPASGEDDEENQNNNIGDDDDDDDHNNDFEMTEHDQDDSFPPTQADDVGLPSEIDAEENKSDDLNDEQSSPVQKKENQAVTITQNNNEKPEEGTVEKEEKNEYSTVGQKSSQDGTHPTARKRLSKNSTLVAEPAPGFQENKGSDENKATSLEPTTKTKPPLESNKANGKGKEKSKPQSVLTDDNMESGDLGGVGDGGHEDDYDDDDDKEGEGFNMVHDPETPESVREERIRQDQEKLLEQKRKKKGKKKGAAKPETPQEDNVSDSDTSTPGKPVKRKTKKKKVTLCLSPKGYPIGHRGYETIPADDLRNDAEPEEGLRRSRRARSKPLEFWRNEKFEYGPHSEKGVLGEAMGNMPVVKHVRFACETPYKKRKVPPKSKTTSKSKSTSKKPRSGYDDHDDIPFDDRKLKRKHDYLEGESATVWNDLEDDAVSEKVIAKSKNLSRHDLPLPSTRKKSDGDVVGKAAQAFNILNEQNSSNYVGYIMGHLALPPKGIKDYESVGLCAQTFTVCHCQPNSLEFSMADPEDEERKFDPETVQRFLLSAGDMFRIPPNNTYQLQNHSKTHDCLLTWTIIRPHSSRE